MLSCHCYSPGHSDWSPLQAWNCIAECWLIMDDPATFHRNFFGNVFPQHMIYQNSCARWDCPARFCERMRCFSQTGITFFKINPSVYYVHDFKLPKKTAKNALLRHVSRLRLSQHPNFKRQPSLPSPCAAMAVTWKFFRTVLSGQLPLKVCQ